jgi:NAD(P)H-flavin reductase
MDTLRELESKIGNFRFVPTLTRLDNSDGGWKGETGYITSEMLSKHVFNLQGSICYVAGPPTMVSAARLALNKAGVDHDDIRTEEFAGY